VACSVLPQGAGSMFASDCIRVLPGHGIQTLNNVSSVDQVPALPADATGGLPEASLCGIGFYSAGGFCLRCPYGAVTRNLGATSVEQCSKCHCSLAHTVRLLVSLRQQDRADSKGTGRHEVCICWFLCTARYHAVMLTEFAALPCCRCASWILYFVCFWQPHPCPMRCRLLP
jgi:hypothetical protein